MKYFFSLVLVLMLAAGCKEKELSYEQVEKKLIKTMQEYLNKQQGWKSTVYGKRGSFFSREKSLSL